jgi:tetratricopeptide (TPR) repeat protein
MRRALRTLIHPLRQHPWRVVLVLGVLVALAGGGVVLWARYQWQAAAEALTRDDLGHARTHLAWCLRFWPNDPSVHLLAARTARRQDDLDEAARHLAECRRLQGVSPDNALEWALLRAQQGDLEADAVLWARAELDGPEVPLILESLAKGYLATFRLTEALDAVDHLLQRGPEHCTGHFLRGTIVEGLGRPEDALAEYRKALDLDPWSDSARRRLAASLHSLGNAREAAAHYETLRRRLGDDSEVLLGLARCRLDAHDLAEAGDLLDAVLARHPDDVAALVERGRVAFQADGAAAAEPWLQRAVACGPHDLEAQRLLLLYLEAQDKRTEAHECLARLSEIEADHTRSNALMLQVLESPHDPALRCEIGTLLLRNGRPAQGVQWLFTALKEDPHYGPAHAALADYYDRTGRPELGAAHRAAP